MHCDCTAGVCTTTEDVIVQSQPNELPNQEDFVARKETATAAVAGVVGASALLGAGAMSPTTGGSLARLSVLTQLCPTDGPTKLDRTLNPLGLEVGDDPDLRQVNGAIVGSIAIQGTLLLICLMAIGVMWCRLRKNRTAGRAVATVAHDVDDATALSKPSLVVINSKVTKRDATFLFARARFGWILLPATFLYGGASLSCASAIMYSTPFYKFLGICDLLVFLIGIPTYAFWVAKRCVNHANVLAVEEPGGFFRRFFWGTQEWVGGGTRHSTAWCELNHLFFDGYKRHTRYFMVCELAATFALGAVGAWSPKTNDLCWMKAALIESVLCIFALLLLVLRPYLTLFENILETLIVLSEVVMMGFIIHAMGTDVPTEDDSSIYAGYVAVCVVYLITGKALSDLLIFFIDEWNVWRGGEGATKGPCGYIQHMLCCGGMRESYDDYVSIRYRTSLNGRHVVADDGGLTELKQEEVTAHYGLGRGAAGVESASSQALLGRGSERGSDSGRRGPGSSFHSQSSSQMGASVEFSCLSSSSVNEMSYSAPAPPPRPHLLSASLEHYQRSQYNPPLSPLKRGMVEV